MEENMKRFYKSDIKKLAKLNEQLALVEVDIYNRAKEQSEIAIKKLLEKENAIYDYELEIYISFYYPHHQGEPFLYWNECTKGHFLNDRHWQIDDKENHNVTSGRWKNKELSAQQHCWLLHRLYDDFNIPWDDILNIENVSFDVKICYQYERDIKL